MRSRFGLLVATLLMTGSLASAQVLFHEDFNDNSAGWTIGPQWQIGAATASGGCFVAGGTDHQDPSFDADGKAGGGIAGIVIGGYNGTAVHGQYWLESPAIDTTGSTNLRLEYDRWLNSDYNLNGTAYEIDRTEVWNGASWVLVWQNGGFPPITDASWVHPSFNITAHSNPRLKVRFGYAQGNTTFTNANASGWNIDNVRITNGEYFFDRFRDNAAGWTLGPEWAIGNATAFSGGSGCGNVDPGSDADGTPSGGIAGVVLGGNCNSSANHGFYYLTSPAINTSGSTLLVLQYDRWLVSDYHPYMHSVVDVWNGTSWVNVFTTDTSCTADSAWSTQSHNISALSNGALQVRFGFDVTLAPSTFDSSQWNLDNLSIHDPAGTCTLGLSAYNGPGSLRVSAHCLGATVPPGTTLFNCFTLSGTGFPTGYFFGISPSLTNEVIPQYSSAALPFVGVSNAQGDVVWDLPVGVPPGITVYAVTVAIGTGGYPAAASPPITYTTP